MVRTDPDVPVGLRARLLVLDQLLRTTELLGLVTMVFDVSTLYRELSAVGSVDFDALGQATSILERGLLQSDTPASRSIFNPAEDLPALRARLADLKKRSSGLEPQDLLLRLELGIDPWFGRLLMSSPSKDAIADLITAAEGKLELFDDAQIAGLWGRLTYEFSEERVSARLPRDTTALPRDFFRYSTPALARTKLARYIVQYRPEIAREVRDLGQTSIPADLFGLGRLLAAKRHSPVSLTVTQQSVARSLSRIAAYYDAGPARTGGDFAKIIAPASDGDLPLGRQYSIAKSAVAEDPDGRDTLLRYELKALALTLRALAGQAQPVERALMRYKLGLEFTAPESRPALEKLDERALQRNLRKYLVDGGIYSFGTDFGQGEADAFIEEHPDSYVIEAKLFRKGSNPTESALRQALIQLQDYMDKTPGPRKGILVLFCFAGPLVIGPREWIQGRYWILPINLQDESASKRRQSISISESKTPDGLIQVLTINSESGSDTARLMAK